LAVFLIVSGFPRADRDDDAFGISLFERSQHACVARFQRRLVERILIIVADLEDNDVGLFRHFFRQGCHMRFVAHGGDDQIILLAGGLAQLGLKDMDVVMFGRTGRHAVVELPTDALAFRVMRQAVSDDEQSFRSGIGADTKKKQNAESQIKPSSHVVSFLSLVY